MVVVLLEPFADLAFVAPLTDAVTSATTAHTCSGAPCGRGLTRPLPQSLYSNSQAFQMAAGEIAAKNNDENLEQVQRFLAGHRQYRSSGEVKVRRQKLSSIWAPRWLGRGRRPRVADAKSLHVSGEPFGVDQFEPRRVPSVEGGEAAVIEVARALIVLTSYVSPGKNVPNQSTALRRRLLVGSKSPRVAGESNSGGRTI